jgi:hypothetical protein
MEIKKMFNLRRKKTIIENPAIVKKKYEQELIIGAYLMLNYLLSYEGYKFTELVNIAVTSVPIDKVITKNTVSKYIDIKILLDSVAEVVIILPYFIKKYNLTIIEYY